MGVQNKCLSGNNLDILKKMERLGILLLKGHGNHISLVGEMDGDEDLKSWKIAGNLLISEF